MAHYKSQGEPVYEASIKERLDKVQVSEGGDDYDDASDEGGADQDDETEKLVRRALGVIRETRRATTSSLQRRLKVGYNKAANLMDELEKRGYIGPVNGNEPREILVDLEGEMPDIEEV